MNSLLNLWDTLRYSERSPAVQSSLQEAGYRMQRCMRLEEVNLIVTDKGKGLGRCWAYQQPYLEKWRISLDISSHHITFQYFTRVHRVVSRFPCVYILEYHYYQSLLFQIILAIDMVVSTVQKAWETCDLTDTVWTPRITLGRIHAECDSYLFWFAQFSAGESSRLQGWRIVVIAIAGTVWLVSYLHFM